MSGKLFNTVRMSSLDIEQLKERLYSFAPKAVFPFNFYDKESHGDLDVFMVDSRLTRISAMEMALGEYNKTRMDNSRHAIKLNEMGDFAKYNSICEPKERFIVQSENQSHIRVKHNGEWRHIDVTFVNSEVLEFSQMYYSYGDLSQLLQIWARKFKLQLKHTGLYYEFTTNGKTHLVRITTNWFDFLDIMQLCHTPYRGNYPFKSFIEAFNWMENSILYNNKQIEIAESDARRERPLFSAFLNYECQPWVKERPTVIGILPGILDRVPSAFQSIMNAKIATMADSNTDTKVYAIESIINVNHFEKTHYDNKTNLNILDTDGYVQFKKQWGME